MGQSILVMVHTHALGDNAIVSAVCCYHETLVQQQDTCHSHSAAIARARG